MHFPYGPPIRHIMYVPMRTGIWAATRPRGRSACVLPGFAFAFGVGRIGNCIRELGAQVRPDGARAREHARAADEPAH